LELAEDGQAKIDVALAVGLARDDRGSIAEKSGEGVQDFRSDFKGVWANARADGGVKGFAGMELAQLGDRNGDNFRHNAAPAGVDGRNGEAVLGAEEDRGAVCGAHGGELGGAGGNNAVGLGGIVPGSLGGGDNDAVTMDLMDAQDLILSGGKGVFQQAAVILRDCFERIALVESGGVAEIEGIKGRGADAADASAKGMLNASGFEGHGMIPDSIGGFCSE
jgi:hypothetical protein